MFQFDSEFFSRNVYTCIINFHFRIVHRIVIFVHKKNILEIKRGNFLKENTLLKEIKNSKLIMIQQLKIFSIN